MKKYNSFIEYILKNHNKDIAKKLLAYFSQEELYATREEYDNPDKYSFELSLNFRPIKIIQFKAPRNNVDFDLVLDCMIQVSDKVGGELQTNFFESFYTISVTAKFDNGLKNFNIYKIYDSNQGRKYDQKLCLSEFLTPYINLNEYEEYANEFLSLYYPEALVSPSHINLKKLLKRLNLTVHAAKLENNVKGQIIFDDRLVNTYDTKRGIESLTMASGGTILINSDIILNNEVGQLYNTVIHECVHWWLHKNYFELIMLLNNYEESSQMFIDDMDMPDEKMFKNKYFIELQARSIAPLILMPRETAKGKFEDILENLLARKSYHSEKKTFCNAVYKFCDFYRVSFNSALIRLEAFGYSEHSFNQLNAGKSTHKMFKHSNEIKRGQTYLVDFLDVVNALKSNPLFANALNRGRYLYIDGFFVLNDERYVKRYKNGKCALTKLALEDVSQCCLLFDTDVESVSVDFDPKTFNMVTFSSGGSKNQYTRKVSINSAANDKVSKLAILGEHQREEIEEATSFINEMDRYGSFHEKLDCLLGDNCFCFKSNRSIASKCNIDHKTIGNFRTGKTRPGEIELLKICGGLKFHPLISR